MRRRNMADEDKQIGPAPEQAGEAPPQAHSAETNAFVRLETPIDAARTLAGPSVLATWIGKTLGKYQVTAVLGQGGMGVVLKARDPIIERDVAIKVLAEHLASDVSALERFLAEAKA